MCMDVTTAPGCNAEPPNRAGMHLTQLSSELLVPDGFPVPILHNSHLCECIERHRCLVRLSSDMHPSDLPTTIVDAICLSSVHKSRLRNFEYCKLYHSLTSPHLEDSFMVTLRTAKTTKLSKFGGERLLGTIR